MARKSIRNAGETAITDIGIGEGNMDPAISTAPTPLHADIGATARDLAQHNFAISTAPTRLRADLIGRARDLAQHNFAARVPAYDREAAFPAEDFIDLHRAGLLSTAVPLEYGGAGIGPYRGKVLTLWLMTKEIAKADLSLARCWEGHCNSMVLIGGLADHAQKKRWFGGVVDAGEIWVAWSGEPQARASVEKMGFGTTTTKVDGG